MTDIDLVGRAGLIEGARGQLDAGGSVLLFGPTGIGKSALARVLQSGREPAVAQVLSAAPSASEAELPYVTLLDLLSEHLDQAWKVLPEHLRQPLEVALLKASAPDSPRDELAVRLAVLHVLRRLAQNGPVLIAVDDIQWADPSSLEVLRFCARRLTDGVQMIATEQAGDQPTTADACPAPLLQLEVPPLAEPDVTALLRGQLDQPLPVRTAQRIFAASAGNPFMALELGRAVLRHPGELSPEDPLPVSSRLKTLLGDRLGELTAPTREVLLYAASSPRPTVDLLAAAAGRSIEAELAEAEKLGLVDVSAGRLRFGHPLLREFGYAEATSAARRDAHARLAAVVTEPVEKARHGALATRDADSDLAAALDEAAAVAGGRGAPAAAATLWRLAAERTPAGEPERRAGRLVRAARDAAAAGHLQESAEVARLAIEIGPGPATMVPARLALVAALPWGDPERADALVAAFAEASGTPSLEAQVRLELSEAAYMDRRLDEAGEHARAAETLARDLGDDETVVCALELRSTVEMSTPGGVEADRLLEEAGRLATGLELSQRVVGARQMAVMRELFQGDTAVAVDGITALMDEVRARGAIRWLASVLVSASAIFERSGRGPDTLAAGRECLQLLTDIGDEPEVGMVVAARSEWVAGSLAAARRHADDAIATCRSAGNHEWIGPALASSGLVAVLAGDPQRAVEAFDAIDQAADMPQDPAVIPWHADYAEALVAAGRLTDARSLIDDVRRRAAELDRTVVEPGMARAEALLMAKEGDLAGALELLDKTLAEAGDRVYPIDLARCELARGRLARQSRRRSVARTAFLAAAERFERLGALPWRQVAEAELARLDVPGRSRQPSELTDNEQQIVAMVRDGSTNREIAAALYLSVKAVESQLTRLYRRFGVANRTQLLRMVERGTTDPSTKGNP